MKCQNTYCENTFTPKNETHKYCSSQCRKEAFEERKYAENAQIGTPVRTPVQEPVNDTLERILKEREDVFTAKLKAMELQHEKNILELRLNKLEAKVKDLEEDQGGGIKTADIMTAFATYFSMQQQQKTTPTESK